MATKTPKEVIEATLAVGENKVALSSSPQNIGRFTVLSVLAGVYIAFGGTLSIVLGYGFPEITAANPSLQRLLSGCAFPIGLILVVVLGAELFTGNNAVLMPAWMQRRYSLGKVLMNWLLVYVGNFVGAFLFVYFMVYVTGLLSADPYHSAIINVAQAKVSMPWHVVLVKGIGANWCVCLAVWLAMSAKSSGAKMFGCWLPVMAFVALGYEHSIANMFFIPAGMLEGANVGIIQMVFDNLLPATIGNVIGGALFVGCVYAYINLSSRDGKDGKMD